MSSLRLGGLLAVALLGARSLAQTCNSYGIDFKNEGSYFQNISSTDAFTFVSIFEGCADDVANNILVDPNGDEYQCTDTDLQPDDSTQLSTCPMDKNELWTGDWSVIIISNNGDDDPIAYERDFYLSVGVPATVTYTPTLTVIATTTPISTITSTSTSTSTVVLVASTKTVASLTYSPTVTVTPAKVTVTVTSTLATIKKTAYTVVPYLKTKTNTATCSVPPAQSTPDPVATFTPTLVTAAALSTDAATTAAATTVVAAKIRRDRMVPLDRDARVAERKARREAANKLGRRAPDAATATVTDTNTSDYPISTVTTAAAAITLTSSTVATVTATSTPPVVTVKSGKTTLPVVTVTAATPTKTSIKYVFATTTVKTSTSTTTLTITTTFTPTQSAVVCTAKGGRMI